MPPADATMPSPALSILKGFLLKHGYSVKIIYWNILLKDIEESFVWGNANEKDLLYAAFTALHYNNPLLIDEIRVKLLSIKPIILNEGSEFLDSHINTHIEELRKRIFKVISDEIANALFFGFTLKMGQWVFASLLAKIVKEADKSIPVVVGGINTKHQAESYINTFQQFDIAIWGEGEYALLDIANYYAHNSKILCRNIVSNISERLKLSPNGCFRFINFNTETIYPDYTDYFVQIKSLKNFSPIIGFEGGRGCHWNRCKFCYLNSGYRYRLKPVESIIAEMRHLISEYGIMTFQFLDNDIMGNDIERYIHLLNELALLKIEYPEFRINAVEIMSIDTSYELVKKMRKAGIEGIQLGYESSSDELLKLINKKNTFATNISLLHHCVECGIRPMATNIISNLIEENEKHIFETIKNIRFFRFIYQKCKGFALSLIVLNINSSSRYFDDIQSVLNDYKPSLNYMEKALFLLIPPQYRWDFFEYSLPYQNSLWEVFKDIQYYFFSNKYRYCFSHEGNFVIYREYLNEQLIEELHFTIDEISILNYTYEKVRSMEDILNHCEQLKLGISQGDIIELLSSCYDKGIVYHNLDLSEVCSLVYSKL